MVPVIISVLHQEALPEKEMESAQIFILQLSMKAWFGKTADKKSDEFSSIA
jgi:hypothetical protein